MGLKEQVIEFLNKTEYDRDHAHGLTLYAAYNDHDPELLKLLSKRANSWARMKLTHELENIVDKIWQDAPQVIAKKLETLDPMPESVRQLYVKQSSLKQTRAAIHSRLIDMTNDDERYTAAIAIIDMTKEIEDIWAIIIEWRRTKKIPVLKSQTPTTKVEQLRRLQNARSSISKRKRLLNNGDSRVEKLESEITELKAECFLLETQLNINGR